jgi:LEA14-like dessication related protein
MRRALLLPLAALGVLAAACGGVQRAPPLDPPALRIESFLPEGADAHGVTLRLMGWIENPNAVQLAVARFTYAIDVEGRRAGAGKLHGGLVLPPAGAAPVSLPVRLRWAEIPGLLSALAARESLAIRVSGAAVVPAGRRNLEIPYAIDGSVVLPRLPVILLEEAAVRRSSILETTVELRFGVQNPNPFALPVGRLSYDLSLSGVSVVKASGTTLAAVPPGGSTTIIVPVRFSSIGAAAGALSGAMRGRADVALVGSAAYGALEVVLDARTALVR